MISGLFGSISQIYVLNQCMNIEVKLIKVEK
jgi:hypothetical protein